MIEIKLANGKGTAIVDDVDGDLADLKWCIEPRGGYARRFDKGKTIYMHRVIAERMELDLSHDIDHIDGNGLNNRRTNLRSATHQQNCMNQRVNVRNKLGVKGVMVDKSGRYRARIRINDVLVSLGTFPTLEEAMAVRAYHEKKFFGEFSRVTNSDVAPRFASTPTASLTGFRGVYPQKPNRFQAQFRQARSRLIHLGTFDTPQEAAAAWNEEARKRGRTWLNRIADRRKINLGHAPERRIAERRR